MRLYDKGGGGGSGARGGRYDHLDTPEQRIDNRLASVERNAEHLRSDVANRISGFDTDGRWISRSYAQLRAAVGGLGVALREANINQE
jgi:hypothetical protein